MFDPWLKDQVNCYKGQSVDEFVDLIEGVVEKRLPSVSGEGKKTAQERSIASVGQQLKTIYETVLENYRPATM